jgi:predicted nucleic acid-binding protein
METARKITVEVPLELLKKARRASGTGITQTVRTGLQLVAASRTYARLRQLRGKVRFTRTLAALEDRQVVMVPVVLTELLSDPKLPTDVAETLSEVPLIEIGSGYWQRAGELRAKVLAKRRKARLGEVLIAQSCIDGGVPLLTRDRDFRAFAEAAHLDLILGS